MEEKETLAVRLAVALLVALMAPLAACSDRRTSGGKFAHEIELGSLEVQPVVAAALVKWDRARSSCEVLVEGGHDDWRLPSAIEMEAIFADADSAPSFVGPPPSVVRDGVWTCTPFVLRPDLRGYWSYSQSRERLSFDRLPKYGRTLCVRGARQDCSPIEELPFKYIAVADPELRRVVRDAHVRALLDTGDLVDVGRTDYRGMVRVRRSAIDRLVVLWACDAGRCGAKDGASVAGESVPVVYLAPAQGMTL